MVALTAEAGSSAALTSNTAQVTVTSGTSIIPVGTVLLFCWCSSAGSAITPGPAASNPVTVSGGAIGATTVDAASVRTSTFDIGILRTVVTTAIPANSTFTFNWVEARVRRNVVLVKMPGVQNVCEASSQKTLGTESSTSVGPNGSSTTETGSTTAAQTTPNSVVVAVGTFGGTNTMTTSSPLTELAQIKTSTGTTDRGLAVGYKEVSANAVQSGSFVQSTSGGWAVAIATYPLEASGFTGSLGLGGSGSLTFGASPKPVQSIALSGSGSLGFAALAVAPGAVTLSGSGSLSLTPVPKPAQTLARSGVGTLTMARLFPVFKERTAGGWVTLIAKERTAGGWVTIQPVQT